jgi:hypothetical protein
MNDYSRPGGVHKHLPFDQNLEEVEHDKKIQWANEIGTSKVTGRFR